MKPAQPLDDIENALIEASNALYDMDDAKHLCVYTKLEEAIDRATRIVQAWKEEETEGSERP